MSHLKITSLSFMMFFTIFCNNQLNDNESRAQYLFDNLMCPVCDGQTISESQSQLSKNMRDIVRIKLDEGLTNEEILQYFQSKYGTSITYTPTLAPACTNLDLAYIKFSKLFGTLSSAAISTPPKYRATILLLE